MRLLYRAAQAQDNPWLMEFLKSVSQVVKAGRPLSPKQQAVLDKNFGVYRVATRYLQGSQNFSGLQPGDPVIVDTRGLFMDDHKWVQVTFIRWTNKGNWKDRDYIQGVRNTMVISSEALRGRIPLLDHIGGKEWEVSTQDVRIPNS